MRFEVFKQKRACLMFDALILLFSLYQVTEIVGCYAYQQGILSLGQFPICSAFFISKLRDDFGPQEMEPSIFETGCTPRS